MGRGLLSGFIWGAVVSILVLGVASLFAPPPVERSGAPAQDRMEMPAGSAFNREKPDTDPVLPVPDLPVDGEAAQPAAPDDEIGAPPVTDTAPASPPDVVQSVEPQAPAPGPVEPAPIAPRAEESGPAIPEGALGVPVPDVEIPMPSGDDSPAALPDVPQPPAPDEDAAPEAPAETAGAGVTGEEVETAEAETAEPAPQPAPDATPEAPAPSPAAPAGQPAEDAAQTEAAPDAEPAAETAASEAAPPAPEAQAPEAPAPETDTAAPADPVRPTLGALSRHAVAFENPQGRPLMSLVLVDAPEDGLDIDVLKTFNFPVTFALDPARADAPARAAVLRDAGFEVIALTPEGQAGLPAHAGPEDVDRALTAFFERIDRGVALLDRPKDGFQRTAPVAEAVIARFEETGHGLLTFDDGLNTTRKKAARAGVPAATVFRMLDAEAERTPKIKRYLDRAAYKAREDGWVIMVGRTLPDTVRALFEWALSEEAETVELAPVSAVLRLMR
ncbi:divergent polysaccharide deacetylase family protein [Rhodovulum sp. YNF3179]|uniref:divergent polysaccharide deacetylase family protein n=1 Tax=Rhodovulum sp. YNF3179 TaxID=3425127 RepID=UPI003D328321